MLKTLIYEWLLLGFFLTAAMLVAESEAGGGACQAHDGPVCESNNDSEIEDFHGCQVSCTVQDFNSSVDHLSEVLRFKTVSGRDTPTHAVALGEFEKLDAWLSTTYADLWSTFGVEKVGSGNLSYLLTWQGTDATLAPVLFISHVDVVPVPEQTVKDWSYGPFSGAVEEGYIWGRGALDVKVTVVAMLEAARRLLAEGYAPQRTLLFAYGHDEEVGGDLGAGQIAELAAQRYGELEMVVDEGASVRLDGVTPFTSHPVALVATAEKTYITLQVRVRSSGGHAATPPLDGSSVADVMSRVIAAIAAAPPPAELRPPVDAFLAALAPVATEEWRDTLARATQAGGGRAVAQLLASQDKELAAMVRMTVAVTRLSAGVADNVLPQEGVATINMRTLPGDGADAALAYLRNVTAGEKEAVEVSLLQLQKTAPPEKQVAPSDGVHFRLLADAIGAVWRVNGQPIPVVPYILLGATDSKHYASLSRGGVLRFCPYGMFTSDHSRVHATDERVALTAFRAAICVYLKVLRAYGDLAPQ